MKNIKRSVVLISAAVFLSGCSLLPGSSKDSGIKLFTDKSSPLEEGVVVGSLWKTSDSGHSFKVKSKIDQAALAVLEGAAKAENVAQSSDKEKKPDDGKNDNSKGFINNSVKTKLKDGEGDIITTADILSIAFNPLKQMVIYVSTANDGLFKTENAGELWQPIPFPPKNVYSFILDSNDPDNRMFASGVVGNWGKIFRTKDGGKNWEEVYTEPGDKVPVTSIAQHINDNNIIFAGTKNGTVVKSTDGGDIWKNVGQLEDYKDDKTKKTTIGEKIKGNVTDFAFDAKSKASLYLVNYGNKLYYSRNTGGRWIDWELEKKRELEKMQRDKVSQKKIDEYRLKIAKEKMPAGIISAVADPLVAGTVYVGTKNGFFVSTSYGKWWKEINVIESAKKYPIRSAAINPKKSKEIVFVSGKAFYKSIDSGKTWETVGLDVDRDVAFVAYDPFDSNYLFVGLRKFN